MLSRARQSAVGGLSNSNDRMQVARDRLTWAVLLLPALLGIVFVMSLTRDGAGASGDSAFYVMGARNLLAGNGYARVSGSGEPQPITGFPPMFSIVLAGLGLAGMDGFEAARYLNAVLFGANLFLGGGLIYLISGSRWAAGIGSGLMLSSMTLVQLHSWVMTEPLYITMFLLSAATLAIGIQRGDLRLHLLAGLLAGFAGLTRYVGVGMVGAGAVTALLVGDRELRRRVRDVGAYLGAAALPLVWWLAGGALGTGTVANRAIIFHPIDPGLIAQYEAELIAWAFARQLPVPWRPRAILAALVAGVGPVTFLVSWIRERGFRRPLVSSPSVTLPWLLGLYLFAHFIILVVNSLFLDAATTISAVARYLAPAYVALVILSVATSATLVDRLRPARWLAIFAAGLAGLIIALHARDTLVQLAGSGLDLGYVGIRRDFPELVEGLDAIDAQWPIISNNPELVYVLVERSARPIPVEFDPYLARSRPDYRTDVDATRALMNAGGVLVIFGKPDSDAQQLMESLNVEPVEWFNTAIIYRLAGEAEG